MLVCEEMKMINVICDYVALKKSLTRYNREAKKKEVEFPMRDFRITHLCGYEKRASKRDKFHRITSFQNEHSHATFDMKVDRETMIKLIFRHRKFVLESFGLTFNDILALIFEVMDLFQEFKELYDVEDED